jgi:flagellar motor switch protein FliM
MRFAMAETPKLSVEKALEKLRAADAQKSKDARRTEEMDALDEEIKRLRAQRLRLDRHPRRSTERD